MAIDPLTLFLQLVILVDRKLEVETENCFYYELTHLNSTFQRWCNENNKEQIYHKKFLLEGVKPTENTE